jgi:hypothetical protein
MNRGDYIVVAADSRSSLHSLDGKFIGNATIQKIHQQGKVYFAVSGHFDQLLTSEAAAAIRRLHDPYKSADAFAKAMKKRYDTLMMGEKKTYRSNYNYYLQQPLAAVAFFGFIKGKSYLIRVELRMKEVKDVPKCNSTIDDKQLFFPLGFGDHIEQLSAAEYQRMASSSKDHAELLKKLIVFEMGYHKEDIACPINFLRVDSMNARWWQEACN